MERFQKGQRIVYGNAGVCEVEEIGQKRFADMEAKEYYTLRPIFETGNDRLYVPTASDAALRLIVAPEEAESYLEEMKDLEVEVFNGKGQTALAEHYQELMQKHSIEGYLRLFKEICKKESLQKSKGRKLNAVDKHFYMLAEQLLSEELAVSLQQSPSDMRKTLRAAAAA